MTYVSAFRVDVIRGVPSGFIQRLEARLAETEAALFMVLRESSQSDAPTDDPQLTATFAKSRASHDKLHRVSEWQDLPLQSMDNIRAWYRWKDSERLGLASQEQPASTDEDNVPSGPQRQVEAQDLDNPSQYYIAQDLSRTPSANSAATVPGRAKDLSQSHRDLYF